MNSPRRWPRAPVSRSLVRRCAPLLLACAVALPSLARAQVADKAAAEALFDEGKRLLEAGNVKEACPKFEASHKRDPGIGTLLFLGECYERSQRVASAWAAFREAASMAKQAGDAREPVARSRADALAPKLFRVSIQAEKPAEGLKVSVDGRALSRDEWAVPLPFDPGSHEVVAEAPGFVTVRKTFDVPNDKGSQTITVPELVKDTSAPPIVPTASATGTAAPPPPRAEPPGKGLLVSGIVVGSVGVLSLGATGVLAALAAGKDSDADEQCDDTHCRTADAAALSSDATTLGNAATGTFIAGLVLAGAGLTLILLQPSDEPGTATAALRVAPGGLLLEGSFR